MAPTSVRIVTKIAPSLVFIGFGEAAMAFAEGLVRAVGQAEHAPNPSPEGEGPLRAYDIRIAESAKRAEIARFGVTAAASNAEAVLNAPLILSLVTADQALAAAAKTAAAIAPGALYCDMNSVAPDTKRAARDLIEAAGGRYVDVAVMAPVLPARRAVPLLVSGPHADAALAALLSHGFCPRSVAGAVGAASAIKMIRSVMVKGLEALTAECFLAAAAAGVTEEVRTSLDASWPGTDWAARADYNLDRMIVHGMRRAAEMEEVVKTLDALVTGSAMTRGTVERQRAIGMRGLPSPDGLAAKIDLILQREARAA